MIRIIEVGFSTAEDDSCCCD